MADAKFDEFIYEVSKNVWLDEEFRDSLESAVSHAGFVSQSQGQIITQTDATFNTFIKVLEDRGMCLEPKVTELFLNTLNEVGYRTPKDIIRRVQSWNIIRRVQYEHDEADVEVLETYATLTEAREDLFRLYTQYCRGYFQHNTEELYDTYGVLIAPADFHCDYYETVIAPTLTSAWRQKAREELECDGELHMGGATYTIEVGGASLPTARRPF